LPFIGVSARWGLRREGFVLRETEPHPATDHQHQCDAAKSRPETESRMMHIDLK
jgi:hypothetical protein